MIYKREAASRQKPKLDTVDFRYVVNRQRYAGRLFLLYLNEYSFLEFVIIVELE